MQRMQKSGKAIRLLDLSFALLPSARESCLLMHVVFTRRAKHQIVERLERSDRSRLSPEPETGNPGGDRIRIQERLQKSFEQM